jgi:hypothetical protein
MKVDVRELILRSLRRGHEMLLALLALVLNWRGTTDAPG